MTELTIKQVREKFPTYGDLNDEQLADKIHGTFYADMDKTAFYKKVGHTPFDKSPGFPDAEAVAAAPVGQLPALAAPRTAPGLPSPAVPSLGPVSAPGAGPSLTAPIQDAAPSMPGASPAPGMADLLQMMAPGAPEVGFTPPPPKPPLTIDTADDAKAATGFGRSAYLNGLTGPLPDLAPTQQPLIPPQSGTNGTSGTVPGVSQPVPAPLTAPDRSANIEQNTAIPMTPEMQKILEMMQGQTAPVPGQSPVNDLAVASNPDGIAVIRAGQRGGLRAGSSLPLAMATSDATALQDSKRTPTQLLFDTFRQVSGLDDALIHARVDLSSPAAAAAAFATMGFPADRANLFSQIYAERTRRADDARAEPDRYRERHLQNREVGQSLLDRAAELPMSPAAERFRKGMAGDETMGGTLSAMVSDPMGALSFLGEVGVESAPMIAASAGAGLLTRSPAISAAVMGTGALAQEFGASVDEFFQENGVKIVTRADAINALNDPNLWREAGKRGMTRGVTIALFEMAGQGAAARKLFDSPVGDAILDSVVQAVTGGGGEAAARAAAGQEWNGQEVLIEALAEFMTAPAEIGAAALSKAPVSVTTRDTPPDTPADPRSPTPPNLGVPPLVLDKPIVQTPRTDGVRQVKDDIAAIPPETPRAPTDDILTTMLPPTPPAAPPSPTVETQEASQPAPSSEVLTPKPQAPAGGTGIEAEAAPTDGGQVGDFDPEQWTSIAGVKNGEETGKTFYENSDTGDVISAEEFAKRSAKPDQNITQNITDVTKPEKGVTSTPDKPLKDIAPPVESVTSEATVVKPFKATVDNLPFSNAEAGNPGALARAWLEDASDEVLMAAPNMGLSEGWLQAERKRRKIGDFAEAKPPATDPGDFARPNVVINTVGKDGLTDAERGGPDPTSRRSRWDAMTPDQRRDLMKQMPGTTKADGTLNKTGDRAAGKAWGDLTEGARSKIDERWNALDVQERTEEADQEPIKNEADVLPDTKPSADSAIHPIDRTFDKAGARWDAMTQQDRTEFLRQQNPKGDPATRDKFAMKSWADLSDRIKAAVTEKMPDDVFAAPASTRDMGVAERHWNGLINGARRALLNKIGFQAAGTMGTQKWERLKVDMQNRLADAMPDHLFSAPDPVDKTPSPSETVAETPAQPESDAPTAATDPAFQAAQDSGKLEVVHVTGKDKPNESEATVRLGRRIADMIRAGTPPKSNAALMKMAAEEFGGTIAEGAFSPKDAYEAMELGMNLFLQSKTGKHSDWNPQDGTGRAKKLAAELQALVETLPTQTRRDTETDAFQQFSTPPSYGFAVNWVANIKDGDRVLEPSAGNGGIAVFAQNAGATVDVNELAERRLPSLKALGFNKVTAEDAEQIANIWSGDKTRTYDVVVMNPPFSAAGSRGTKNTSATGAKHLQQALALLKPGGRLVAIMGHTFQPGNSRVTKFFDGLDGKMTLQANVVVKGDQVYKKYGTAYDNRLLVIDKAPALEGHKTLTGEVANIPDLIALLEDVRNATRDRSSENDASLEDGAKPDRETSGKPADDGGRDGAAKPQQSSKPDDLGSAGDGPGRDGGSVDPDGAVKGAGTDSKSGSRKGKPAGTDAKSGTAGSSGATAPDSKRPTVRVSEAAESQVEETSGGFAKYRPTRVRIEGAVEHPMLLVESSAMATVNPPTPNYDLQLPPKMVKDGLLSEAQLEQVVYAGAAHSEMLPAMKDGGAPRRKGFYIGDGTGVGKTREIAGIVADNWAQGRKKHILISKTKKLLKSARRDFDMVGMKAVPIADLGAVKATGEVPKGNKGVLFATYSAIGRGGKPDQKSRLDQIVDWVGPDFDGTITFDEAHLAGNAMAIKGKRGTTKPSGTALAVVELQQRLPNARVVYASATAATEVYNLAYADRLGLWGPGTPFPTVQSFVTQIDKGGIAAMEVVARDMKQMGVYMARTLSFEGVEYAKVEHNLTPDQSAMYDAAAEGWQTILANVDKIIEEETQGGGRQRGAALAAFWGAHQRFFSQVLTAMQMPTVLKNIEADLKAGMSPVIQIVNTNEAATNRAMAKMEEGDTLDDIDITPREDIMMYLETSFPIHQYETYVDDNGNERQRPAEDSKGNFIINAEAVRIRDELVGKLGAMTLPGNPLDMIIEKFGSDKVAEITGRSNRIVTKNGKKVKERRSETKALAEVGEFQAGKRQLLVFSDAGGTGMDFHADKGAKNKGRRAHYVLQAGWRADRAIQGFGRTHRTNQVQPPIYKLAGTNLSGHKRFTSSIARRLDQLGALTKGQKDASGSGMFNATDNLENDFAEAAVTALFYDIYHGDVDGFTAAEVEKELGLKLVGEKGFNVSKVPAVPQFLNRLLNTKIDTQNMLFEKFIEHMEAQVQHAIDNGEYTSGVETVKHDGAVLTDTKPAYRDEKTGATSQYQMVKVTKKLEVTPFTTIDTKWAKISYKKHRDTGQVFAFRPASSRTGERGEVIPTYNRYSPTDRIIVDSSDYQFRYDMVQADEAETAWNEQVENAPDTREETLHLVTGALLPIWDRLPSRSPKIVRLTLDDGRSLLGREIPDVELTRTLDNLGVTGPDIDMSAAEIQAAVLQQNKTVLLSSGHKLLRRRVGNEQRIEVISPPEHAYSDAQPGGTLQRMGFQIERINYKARAFAATGANGVPVIDKFMAGKRIVNVTMERDQKNRANPTDYGPALDIPLVNSLRSELKRLGLGDVDIRFNPAMAHQGSIYAGHMGKIAITIGNTLNPKATLGHEAIHAYRHMGLFTDQEWSALSETAESEWMELYDIETRYPDLLRAEQIEEAVAEAFGEAYSARTTPPKGPIREAFRKIANFLRAVRNWAKGHGMQTSADIIHALARGEFAKRRRPEGWTSQTERLMKQQRKPRQQPGMHLPDRYVWDSLIHTNGGIMARVKAAKSAAGDRLDSTRQKVQDRFLPVLRAQQIVERQMQGPIPEELNTYLAEEMYSGRAGHKLDRIDFDYTTKIIDIIGKTDGMTVETVGRYLYARHAEERNERIAQINDDLPDGGSGMDTQEAVDILDAIHSSPEGQAYQDIGALVDTLRAWSIDERQSMGLMTKFEADAWRKAYKAYVPLKGWAETDNADAELDITGVGRGYNVRGPESKAALGRRSEAFNPLVAAIAQAQEVAIRAEKNRVGQHLYRLAKDVPAKNLWTVKKTETKRVFNEATGLVEERSVAPISLLQASNEIAVKVDGIEHRIMLHDQRLAEAITAVGTDNLLVGLQWLSKFSRYFSAINTMLNPVFVVKNFVRDTVTANINIQSREKAGVIQRGMMKDLPKALAGAYRGMGGNSDTVWAKYFQEYSETGGKVSFWVMETPESSEKKLSQRLRREANGLKGMSLALITPSTSLNPVLGAIERINLAVDNAIRLSAFVHARKNGYSAQEAASLAKNLTVNFNRRGKYGSLINAAYTFANAGLQGTHIMFKALKSNKVKGIVAGMAVIGFMLDQANAYLSDEDEDGQLYYDKMRQYLHGMHLMVMLGGKDKAADALSIWLPYGYNVFPLFGNLVSRVQRGQIGADEAIGEMARATFQSFSPIAENTLMGTLTPTIVDPLREINANQNFLGWSIHPYWESNAPNAMRPGDASQVSAVAAAKLNAWTGGNIVESGFADVFPEDIDHVAGFFAGGMGRTFGQSVDLFAKMANGDPVEVRDVPLAKDVYRQIGEAETRSLYFDRREKIQDAYRDAKDLTEAGLPIPAHTKWLADLNTIKQESERLRKGTKKVTQDVGAAYLRLNKAYIAAWKANTPYSSESIFD